MSTNRQRPLLPYTEAELRRMLQRERRKRGLGEYTDEPSAAPAPVVYRKCHNCDARVQVPEVRCSRCKDVDRKRVQSQRARDRGKPLGRPRKADAVWVQKPCEDCGKTVNTRKSSNSPVCQACRRRRAIAASPDRPMHRTPCTDCGKSIVTLATVEKPRCMPCQRRAKRVA